MTPLLSFLWSAHMPEPTETNSSISTYKRCPYMYSLAYVLGLRPIRNAKGPLWFGSGLHLGLEVINKGGKLGDALSQVQADMLSSRTFEPEQDVWEDIIKVQELLIGYVQCYGASARKPIYVEKKFHLPVIQQGAPHDAAHGVHIGGKLDFVFEEAGLRYLEDHKTTGEDIDPGADYWLKLLMDGQMSMYCYALMRMGEQVDGVVYDLIHKPRIRVKKNETLDQFRARLREEIAGDKLKYFRRHETGRTTADLEAFERDLWEWVAHIYQARKAEHFPKNTEACLDPYRCQYFGVCTTGGYRAGDAVPEGFEIVKDMHPELKGDK